jgi:serine O-acetyltransferase
MGKRLSDHPAAMPERRSWMVSSTIEDWRREHRGGTYSPGKSLLRTIRIYQRLKARGGIRFVFAKPFLILRHRFWSAVSGADIPLNSKISGGLLLPHPNGVVIHPDAVIGPNCLIFQQVTIGTGSKPGTPVIEGHVDIGAGAKILGGIRIGEHSVIGANAVVIDDVPKNSIAVGIPAVIKRKKE